MLLFEQGSFFLALDVLLSSFKVFPLRDDISSHRFPVVNYAMIGLCVIVFILQTSSPDGLVGEFGMIPARISHPGQELIVQRPTTVQTPLGRTKVVVEERIPETTFHPFTTLMSCIFLHGSLMHLLGNIWFLYVFGDNVEDRMGPFGYLFFYLSSGIVASLAHFAFQPNSDVPTIGASGAVAGVMGAYMWLYPHAKVVTIIPILFILQMIVVPAPIFLGIWFVIQLVQGTFSMGGTAAAGVAWWAHAGGFTFGFAIAWLIKKTVRAEVPSVTVIVPRD